MASGKAKIEIVVEDPYETEFAVLSEQVAAVELGDGKTAPSGGTVGRIPSSTSSTRLVAELSKPDSSSKPSTTRNTIVVEDPYEVEYAIIAAQTAAQMDTCTESFKSPGSVLPAAEELTEEAEEPPRNIVMDAFGEMITDHPGDEPLLTVVLDCANIGWAYGHTQFNVDGVIKAISFFESLNIRVVGFLPLGYLRKKTRARMETEDYEKLENLARNNRVSMVPAGDHDDSYILSFARENNAFVISNDLFIDHMQGIHEQSTRRSMALWLRVNRISYTFVRQVFVLNPKSVLMDIITEQQERREAAMDTCSSSSAPNEGGKAALASSGGSAKTLRLAAILDDAISLYTCTSARVSAEGELPAGVLLHLYHARAALRMHRQEEEAAVDDLKAALRS